MAHSINTRRSKSNPDLWIGFVQTSSRMNSTVLFRSEPMADRGDAYRAAEAWRTENAAKNKAAKTAKESAHMTCQCCGRGHLANKGLLAHHGYQRPGNGWQTASCSGARELPFEVSRDVLGNLIKRLTERRDEMVSNRDEAIREEIGFPVSFNDRTAPKVYSHIRRRDVYPEVTVEFTRATFDALMTEHGSNLRSSGKYIMNFDEIKDRNISRRNHDIKNIGEYITECQTRYDGWKMTKWVSGLKTLASLFKRASKRKANIARMPNNSPGFMSNGVSKPANAA